ncbi:MAG: (2Fe-2S)-binding domain protein [candidate division TA06 bacterium 34_109]|uniref:(2Fe-2S)-binding domain protein n=1 Tax=candidate division TA06 bacterium 34_109 TaxID=1635277 RepID=A0A101HZK5_UNCT6|nr:MAG: (2Fe-2S)-binding domain protein [candidate division TA06 bacterium 34_109]
MVTKKIELNIKVNNKDYKLLVSPNKRLLDVLREDLGLNGVKEGCGIGECGACTIVMNGKNICSCMVLAGQAEGAEIITIEGLTGPEGELHPLQEAFMETGAVQCGFCTPGMILSSLVLLRNNPSPTKEEIRAAISGNFCRCTGYQQIIEAVQLAAEKMRKGGVKVNG